MNSTGKKMQWAGIIFQYLYYRRPLLEPRTHFYRKNLLKQPEDHDRKIFQSYCLQSQLCTAGLTTLTFILLFQEVTCGLDRAVSTSPGSGVTPELSKTDNSKIMPSFCIGKTALSSSSNPINSSLTTVYISNSKCSEKKKKKLKKKIFQGQNVVFNFFMNKAMAAVWPCLLPLSWFLNHQNSKGVFPSLSNIHR